MATGTEIESKLQEVRFEHTPNFAQVLEQLKITLLVSTYQAGKLLVIGSHEGKLSISFHGFVQVMGVAVCDNRRAIGSRRQVHFLNPVHEFALIGDIHLPMAASHRCRVHSRRNDSRH